MKYVIKDSKVCWNLQKTQTNVEKRKTPSNSLTLSWMALVFGFLSVSFSPPFGIPFGLIALKIERRIRASSRLEKILVIGGSCLGFGGVGGDLIGVSVSILILKQYPPYHPIWDPGALIRAIWANVRLIKELLIGPF
jgi:hypothetical protein